MRIDDLVGQLSLSTVFDEEEMPEVSVGVEEVEKVGVLSKIIEIFSRYGKVTTESFLFLFGIYIGTHDAWWFVETYLGVSADSFYVVYLLSSFMVPISNKFVNRSKMIVAKMHEQIYKTDIQESDGIWNKFYKLLDSYYVWLPEVEITQYFMIEERLVRFSTKRLAFKMQNRLTILLSSNEVAFANQSEIDELYQLQLTIISLLSRQKLNRGDAQRLSELIKAQLSVNNWSAYQQYLRLDPTIQEKLNLSIMPNLLGLNGLFVDFKLLDTNDLLEGRIPQQTYFDDHSKSGISFGHLPAMNFLMADTFDLSLPFPNFVNQIIVTGVAGYVLMKMVKGGLGLLTVYTGWEWVQRGYEFVSGIESWVHERVGRVRLAVLRFLQQYELEWLGGILFFPGMEGESVGVSVVEVRGFKLRESLQKITGVINLFISSVGHEVGEEIGKLNTHLRQVLNMAGGDDSHSLLGFLGLLGIWCRISGRCACIPGEIEAAWTQGNREHRRICSEMGEWEVDTAFVARPPSVFRDYRCEAGVTYEVNLHCDGNIISCGEKLGICPENRGCVNEYACSMEGVACSNPGQVTIDGNDCVLICGEDGYFEEAAFCETFRENYRFEGEWTTREKEIFFRYFSQVPPKVFGMLDAVKANKDIPYHLLYRVSEREVPCGDGLGENVGERVGCTMAYGQSVRNEKFEHTVKSPGVFYVGDALIPPEYGVAMSDYQQHVWVHEMGHMLQIAYDDGVGKYCDTVSESRFSRTESSVSEYAKTNCFEDFAESFDVIVRKPCEARELIPQRYEYFMEQYFENTDHCDTVSDNN